MVPQQIEAGRLATQAHKVLILIHTLAMPATTAKAIAEFVRAGGLVIANETPATYDENLRPAPGGSLLSPILGKPNELRKTGQGGALILSPSEIDYRRERFTARGTEVRRRLADTLAQAKLPRFAEIVPAQQDVGIPGLELVVYQSGQGQYLGFVHSAPGPIAATVRIPGARHVYDLRAKQYLGLTKEWPLSLRDGETALYAALPYAIRDVTATPALPTAVRGKPFEASISVRTERGEPATLPHSLVVDVIDPKGRRHPHYSQVVVSSGPGQAQATVPFALSDLPGTWTLRIADRASNQSGELSLELR